MLNLGFIFRLVLTKRMHGLPGLAREAGGQCLAVKGVLEVMADRAFAADRDEAGVADFQFQ